MTTDASHYSFPVPAACKLHKLAKDNDRHINSGAMLLNAYVSARRIIASNGRAMAVVPIAGDMPGDHDPALVPLDVLQHIGKAGRDDAKVAVAINAEGAGTITGTDAKGATLTARVESAAWPDADAIIRSAADAVRDGARSVRISVKILAALADAMGCDAVELVIPAPTDGKVSRAITVRPTTGSASPAVPDALGIIMPIAV